MKKQANDFAVYHAYKCTPKRNIWTCQIGYEKGQQDGCEESFSRWENVARRLGMQGKKGHIMSQRSVHFLERVKEKGEEHLFCQVI